MTGAGLHLKCIWGLTCSLSSMPLPGQAFDDATAQDVLQFKGYSFLTSATTAVCSHVVV